MQQLTDWVGARVQLVQEPRVARADAAGRKATMRTEQQTHVRADDARTPDGTPRGVPVLEQRLDRLDHA